MCTGIHIYPYVYIYIYIFFFIYICVYVVPFRESPNALPGGPRPRPQLVDDGACQLDLTVVQLSPDNRVQESQVPHPPKYSKDWTVVQVFASSWEAATLTGALMSVTKPKFRRHFRAVRLMI